MTRQADARFNKRIFWLALALVSALAAAAMIHVDALLPATDSLSSDQNRQVTKVTKVTG